MKTLYTTALLFVFSLVVAQENKTESTNITTLTVKNDTVKNIKNHNLKLDISNDAKQATVAFDNFWKAIFTNNISLFSKSTGVKKGDKNYNKYSTILPTFEEKLKNMNAKTPKVLGVYKRNNVYLMVVEENIKSKRITEHFVFKVNDIFYATDENLRRKWRNQGEKDMTWLFEYWRKFKPEILQELNQSQTTK